MEGIPPARASDNEDVIWALETAESLWKRNARVDAIVWVRRAAQEAAEAGDADRASSLMVEAAALTEAIARASGHTRAADPVTTPPPGDDSEEDLDSLLAGARTDDEAPAEEDGGDIDSLLGSAVDALAAADDVEAPAPETPRAEDGAEELDADDVTPLDEDDLMSIPPPTPVPAGGEAALEVAVPPDFGAPMDFGIPTQIAFPVTQPRVPPTRPPVVPATRPGPFQVAPAPTPLPPPPPTPTPTPPPDSEPPPESEPAPVTPDLESEPVPRSYGEPPASPHAPQPAPVAGITEMGPEALSPLDLEGIATLAAATPDERERLVAKARVILCADGVELPECGLALVLEGEVTATLDENGSVIVRVGPGGLMCRRGTLDLATGVHLEVTAADSTIALWSEAALSASVAEEALDALRAQGDRLLAWTCLARSALAARLHDDVRLRLFERFTPRALAPGAELLAGGQPVPGILLVGDGSVTIDGVQQIVGTGEFVFPEATLSAARAPATARAGGQGAVVLASDRKTTQELWATEPLLLELVAGS